ncbi:hypothetical protein GCM10009720_15960 [Yaniella flava]|uniref:PEGA domain-containing protein n=1 Tax=Yaniella flava TaxID=287930 RepID=A0ABP5FXM3_9MICC
MSKSIKTYWPIAGIIAVLAVIVLALLRPWSTPETELTFEVSPNQVDVVVGGEDMGEITHGEVVTVELSGEVMVEASSAGFEPDSLPITVEPGEAQIVHVSLIPSSEEAEELVEEEEAVSEEQIVTEEYHELAEDMHDKHPILHDLPQEGSHYGAYQGLPEGSSTHDFGVHLHLYSGHEDKGREQFHTWMEGTGYNPGDYLIVETVKDEAPPVAAGDGPSWSELKAMGPQDISVPSDASADGLSVDELALHFVDVSTTWDAGEDIHHTDGLIRSKPLMTSALADTVQTPHRPTPSESWWTAYEHSAKSYPWIIEYEALDHQNDSAVEMSVCWAWIADDMEPVIDGPRTLEATIDTTGETNVIDDFHYVDPDDFVDNSGSPCIPEDAP